MSSLNKAVELLMAGRIEEARRACRKAVRDRPDLPEAHMLLAETQRVMGDAASARESTARVLRLKPAWSSANIAFALADLYRDFGRLDEAEKRYRRALEEQPDLTDARYNLAGMLHGTGRMAEAIVELEKLLERQPDAADVRERLVQLLFDERRIDRLDAVCREGMARFPGASVYPDRLGTALWYRGRHEEGMRAFSMALERATSTEAREDASLNKASSLLALGRYAEGWKAFQGRHSRAHVASSHPELMGDPAQLATLRQPARIRVLGEQGLGDELFFLRFAGALRERGHRLDVAGEPKLVQLLAGMPELSGARDEAAAFTICSGDLPLASGAPFAPPLALRVDPARRARMKAALERLGPPPYVGVTWRGGLLPDEPAARRDAYLQKKLPPGELAEAIAPVEARVVVLQRRPAAGDLQLFTRQLGREALDLSAANEDLGDALALLSLLDDYVGVSNTNVHLRAGLAGMPARILVSMPAEWRWALGGDTSPWFPEFTVYRRSFGEDWKRVLLKLSGDLMEQYGAPQHK